MSASSYRYRNILHFLALVFLGFLSFLLTKFHYFANPVAPDSYNSIFFFQFLLVFSGYCISLRLGRILLVVGILLLSRLPNFSYSNLNLTIVGGYFTGGVFGLAFKIFLDYSRISPFVRSIHDRFTFTRGLENRGLSFAYLPVVVFLVILLLERFIQFFHFPLLTGTDLQNYNFFPKYSSLSLYTMSANILIPLLYSLIYFYAEERSFSNFNQGAFRDFGEGVLYSFAIQSIVIFIQTFISVEFLAQNTDGIELNRAVGLFRDTASANWMFPLLLVYSLHYAVKELNISEPKHIFFLSLGLLFMGGILGFKQGKSYIIILFSSFILFHLQNFRRYRNNLGFLKTVPYIAAMMIFISIAFVLFATYANDGRLWKMMREVPLSLDFISVLQSLDSYRLFLNRVAIQNFEANPIFGAGVSSVPLVLMDSNLPEIDMARMEGVISFYTGILSDVGIFGALLILIWVFLQIYWRGHFSQILYLVIPLLFGYHVLHPDGSVFLIMILVSLHRIKFMPEGRSKYISVGLTGIALLFLIKPSIYLFTEKKVPEFRYSVLGVYQLSALSMNREINPKLLYPEQATNEESVIYHSFRGKLIWKLGVEKGKLKTCTFLGDETPLNTTRMRWTYYDRDYNDRGHEDISISRFDMNAKINIPVSAEYVVLEELDSADFPKNRGTIFNVKSSCFTIKNDFVGEKF